MIDRDMTIWRQRHKMNIKLKFETKHVYLVPSSTFFSHQPRWWCIYTLLTDIPKKYTKKLKSTMITIKRLQMHIKDTFIFKEDDLVMVRLCLEIFYSGTCEKLQTKNVGSFQWSATKFFSNYIIFNARDWISSSQII